MANSTPSNGLDTANQKETSQPEPWALGSVFILCFSSVRRSTFHVARNFFRNVERSQENLDRRVGTRGLGENATWLRPHHDFRAGSASHRYRAKQNCDTFRFVSFETKPVRCPRSRLKAGSPRSATGRTTRAGPLSNRALRVAWKAGHLRAAKVFRALC